jgi:hypothetical protein
MSTFQPQNFPPLPTSSFKSPEPSPSTTSLCSVQQHRTLTLWSVMAMPNAITSPPPLVQKHALTNLPSLLHMFPSGPNISCSWDSWTCCEQAVVFERCGASIVYARKKSNKTQLAAFFDLLFSLIFGREGPSRTSQHRSFSRYLKRMPPSTDFALH